MAVLPAAEQLKAKGVDVADFGPGEPDFPTPEHIKRAAIKALEENRTKYTATPGIAPLRQAICDWHAAQLGSSVSAGGVHRQRRRQARDFQRRLLAHQFGRRGDIPAPYWVSYPDIVKYAGGKAGNCANARGGRILRCAPRISRSAITPRTRMVIVNSPSNPTGARDSPGLSSKGFSASASSTGVWLLSDECYSHFTYGDAKPFSIASVPGAKDRLIIAGSLSKTFAMTGWRIGYALAPQPLVAAMTKTAEPVDFKSHFDRAVCARSKRCAGLWTRLVRCSPNTRGAANALLPVCARFRA